MMLEECHRQFPIAFLPEAVKVGVCKHRQCLCAEASCPNLEVDRSDYLSLLRKLRKLPKVKKVFKRSRVFSFRLSFIR